MGFLFQAPLVLIAATAMAVFLPETTRKEKTPFDLAGAVTLGIGMVKRVADRSLAVAGGLFLVVSMFIYTQFGPGHSIWFLVLALALAGVGMGIASPVLTAAVADTVCDEDLGVAGAAQQMLQQVGLVIGVQVLQAVQSSGVDNGIVESYHRAFVVATLIALGGAVFAFFLPTMNRAALE